MKHLLIPMLAMAVLLVSPVGAIAQPLSKILASSGLTPQDFEMMDAAEQSLYANAAPKQGHKAGWTNPASGAAGDVRLEAVEGKCVRVHHAIRVAKKPDAVEFRKRMCQGADGRWLLTP